MRTSMVSMRSAEESSLSRERCADAVDVAV
jgi:hypothetical protein